MLDSDGDDRSKSILIPSQGPCLFLLTDVTPLTAPVDFHLIASFSIFLSVPAGLQPSSFHSFRI